MIEANCEMDTGARSRQAENQTPLHFAVRHGHEQIVRLLIEAGCDVNVVRRNEIYSCILFHIRSNIIFSVVYFVVHHAESCTPLWVAK